MTAYPDDIKGWPHLPQHSANHIRSKDDLIYLNTVAIKTDQRMASSTSTQWQSYQIKGWPHLPQHSGNHIRSKDGLIYLNTVAIMSDQRMASSTSTKWQSYQIKGWPHLPQQSGNHIRSSPTILSDHAFFLDHWLPCLHQPPFSPLTFNLTA